MSVLWLVDRLPQSLSMADDPYAEFAREQGEVPGRTRGIRSGESSQKERQAYICHRVEKGPHGDLSSGWEPIPGLETTIWSLFSRASEVAQ